MFDTKENNCNPNTDITSFREKSKENIHIHFVQQLPAGQGDWS